MPNSWTSEGHILGWELCRGLDDIVNPEITTSPSNDARHVARRKKRSSKDLLKYVHAVAASSGIVIQKSSVVEQGGVDLLERRKKDLYLSSVVYVQGVERCNTAEIY